MTDAIPTPPDTLKIRTMTADDIPLGLQLCRFAGWNQLEADWRRLLALEPDGLFVAEDAGIPCGTSSTTCYGKRTAWIGMVLMHPDFRKRGIGTALLVRCIEHLRARQIESIKLDATDLGRPVYLKLDFHDERPIWRYRGQKPAPSPPRCNVRPIASGDWPSIAALDRLAFDADRIALLKLLAADGDTAIIEAQGIVRAFGFARRGYHASFLGPVVASDDDAARAVIETLLAGLPNGEVFWDILPDNTACVAIAESLGFTVARRLMRMYLGDKVNPGDVGLVYGAAGFEVG
ncbi:MAG: GNAT family N-acetyltransferase [Candidatus Sumerlaeia bacterium]|nr:GNAT family N-acetyltransferase [Candidatus Sumerlaeia bacterium]